MPLSSRRRPVSSIGVVSLKSSIARPRLLVLLAVSAGLRLWLAVAGGQRWWPDESRFDASLDAVREALLGHFQLALSALFGAADHVGFKVLGLIPALAITAGCPLWLAAAFFGGFSVVSIYLVWRIAWLTSQGDESVAWWSAFFAASSVSLFYYSRHLLPYDPALCFGLYAIVAGWRDPARLRSAFVAGLWAGIGFLTYNGYWLFCGAALLVAVVGPAPRVSAVLRRCGVAAVGLAAPIALTVLLGVAAGQNLVHGALGFAQTVNFGDFAEGWSFVWKYLWATEGWMLIVWGVAVVAAVAAPRRRRYALVWLGALLFLYVGLGMMSAVAHEFVLYGRIARGLVPFFALVAGAAMAELRERGGAVGAVALASVFVVAAVVRFAGPLAQWFPDDFAARGRELIARHAPAERIRIVNAYSMYRPVYIDADAIGDTLFARRHPLQYEPFLYENLNPEQRAGFRRHDLTMRVVRLPAPAPGAPAIAPTGLDGYPGPLRLTVRLPGEGAAYSPLLVTGTSARAGDYLNVIRAGPGRYRFSFVHWYAAECLSPELTLDDRAEHTLDIAFGSLLPPAAPGAPSAALRRWVFVAVDGQPVFDQPAEFYPATPGGIDIGCNYLGGVTSDFRFRGQIVRVSTVDPDVILRAARAGLPVRR